MTSTLHNKHIGGKDTFKQRTVAQYLFRSSTLVKTMQNGVRYRFSSVLGVILFTVFALLVANHPLSQHVFTTYVPRFWRLDPIVLEGTQLRVLASVTILTVVFSLLPLYKPRPRRALTTIVLIQKRVLIAGLALAALGYFQWSHRLPRATLTMLVGILLIVLPMWFVWIQRTPNRSSSRAVIIGDDLEQIRRIQDEAEIQFVGYLCPTNVVRTVHDEQQLVKTTDGGYEVADLDRIGGIARLEDVLLAYDIDTVVLAFQQADREEFFGALNICYEHGIDVKMHRDYVSGVLTTDTSSGPLIRAEIEPWDLQDYVLKRALDVSFASVVLAVTLPVVLVAALAVKIDSHGPILFTQTRTAGLGGEITIYKLRTMVDEPPSAEPGADSDRVTSVGRLLRRTHIDEIPQLWLVLIGHMSVVGPRPVWTDEEPLLEVKTDAWRKRWFVKPGLTGLAQIRGAGSDSPESKLRSDLEYIRRQSFSLDVYIIAVQLWMVVLDIISAVTANKKRRR